MKPYSKIILSGSMQYIVYHNMLKNLLLNHFLTTRIFDSLRCSMIWMLDYILRGHRFGFKMSLKFVLTPLFLSSTDF